MSKGRLPAILLNADFYSKGRNIRWMKENGYESIPILQAVWIASSQEKDCKISKDDAYSIPFLLTFDFEKIKKILESAVEVGLLDGDETHYWNSQIVKDAKKFQSKHNNYSRASKERERAKQEQDSARILPKLGQNHIDNEYDNESDNESIKENSQPPDYSHYPPEEQQKFALAESMLESTESPRVQRSNQFIMASRRPMLKWPDIWLSPHELVQVIDNLISEGIEPKKRKQVFDSVQSRIKTKLVQGCGIEKISAYNWLTGFEITETLKQIKAKKDVERSNEYLTNARG